MKRWAIALSLLVFAGCGPSKEEGATPSGGSTKQAKSLTVSVVTDAGGVDDESFNAAAWAGAQTAKAELGINAKLVESKEQSDYATNLSTLAEQGSDLVFAVGFLMEDALKEVAPKYPNVKFAIIDGTAPEGAANCESIKFREEEGSFLAGFLAASMSKSGTIGFIGGMDSPLIKKFECGYFAGARTAKPDIRMIPKYVGNWTDAAKGSELARGLINTGADIIFCAAGKGGTAALGTIAEKGAGYYGIGVDSDQDGLHPGRVLTSMMKGVDTSVVTSAKALKNGTWKAGNIELGIKEGGVHLSPMKHTKDAVPKEVLDKIDTLSKMIADEKIKVPKTAEESQNFQLPKL
jgi:basic membrane protein A